MQKMRYTIKVDHQPRIKIDSRGYLSLSEAMGRADRAAISGKCTCADVIGANGSVLYSATRMQVESMLSEWTPTQVAFWRRG